MNLQQRDLRLTWNPSSAKTSKVKVFSRK